MSTTTRQDSTRSLCPRQQSKSAGRYLLLLSCSKRKVSSSRPMPALSLYDGVNFRIIRKLKREGKLPKQLDILILSAKYGLIRSGCRIRPYDLRMTEGIAARLGGQVRAVLSTAIRRDVYRRLFVNCGVDYQAALPKSLVGNRSYPVVTFASGGIGRRMSQMKMWILSI